MIELDALKAQAGTAAVGPLSAAFGAGTFALLGTPGDGVLALLDVLSARVRPKKGAARVAGEVPWSAAARRVVAHVPRDAVLPDALRVEEALHVASAIRGEPARDAALRLSALGLEPLARRPVRSLSREEVRAVALAEAVTSTVTRVLLLDEPLAQVDGRALANLPAALRRKRDEGACILVATTSTRDARDLADEVLLFDRGALVQRAPAGDPRLFAGGRGFRLHVVTSDARALLRELAHDPAIAEAALGGDGQLALEGADPVAMARGVARGVAATAVVLEAMRLEPLTLEDARVSFHEAAAQAARAAQTPIAPGAA